MSQSMINSCWTFGVIPVISIAIGIESPSEYKASPVFVKSPLPAQVASSTQSPLILLRQILMSPLGAA